jgi:hypothetical protein
MQGDGMHYVDEIRADGAASVTVPSAIDGSGHAVLSGAEETNTGDL